MKKLTKNITLALGLIGAFLLSGCDPIGSLDWSLDSESATSQPSSSSSSSNTSQGGSSVSSSSSSGSSSNTSQGGSSVSSSSSSSSSSSDICASLIDSRYSGLDFNTYGATFRNKLASYITGKTATYSECKSIGMKAMAYPNESSNTFIPFYHEAKDSEKATSGECNREHCWPDSRGGGLIENDPIVIRPTLSDDNSHRGNNFYGNTASNEWDPASCGYTNARGESARVILYAACRYYDKGLSLSSNPSDSTGKKTMGTLKTLLKWNMDYKPTAWEKTVNERYAKMGYARNPFVEHPEYANFIWEDNGLRTKKYEITVCDGESTSSYSSESSIPSSSSIPPSSSSSSTGGSSSSSSGGGTITATFKKTFDISDWPGGYTNTGFTSGGVGFYTENCGTGYTAGSIQMRKNGEGFFYNTTPISGYDYIALKLNDSKSPYISVPVVTAGSSTNPSTNVSPVQSDGYYWYQINNAQYFKVSSGSSYATYITEFHLA